MAPSREFGSIRHLAGRFFGALLPFGPPDPAERWARDHLLPGEQALWQRMSGPDRRHALGVARRTVADLTGPPGSDGTGATGATGGTGGTGGTAGTAGTGGSGGTAGTGGSAGTGEEGDVGREVVAAALLHDVGKVEAGLGTWARAGVTFAAMAFGREQLVTWSGAGAGAGAAGGGDPAPRPGYERSRRRRIGLYFLHDVVGADLLYNVGSDPLTVAWAGEHHRPPERWSVDRRVAAALKLADDD